MTTTKTGGRKAAPRKASPRKSTARSAERPEVTAARSEGLLDPRVLELPVERWPGWARARYAGDLPAGDGPVEPLTVQEAAGA